MGSLPLRKNRGAHPNTRGSAGRTSGGWADDAPEDGVWGLSSLYKDNGDRRSGILRHRAWPPELELGKYFKHV